MTQRPAPSPSTGTIHVEESTPLHWVASCGDVVLTFAYDGSHDDVDHVRATGRAVERVVARTGKAAGLLFVLPPIQAKAPSPRVRDAILHLAGKLDAKLRRVGVVVIGEGFAAATHRSVVAGVLLVTSRKRAFEVKVVGGVREGLAYLMGSQAAGLGELARVCEARARGPVQP